MDFKGSKEFPKDFRSIAAYFEAPLVKKVHQLVRQASTKFPPGGRFFNGLERSLPSFDLGNRPSRRCRSYHWRQKRNRE